MKCDQCGYQPSGTQGNWACIGMFEFCSVECMSKYMLAAGIREKTMSPDYRIGDWFLIEGELYILSTAGGNRLAFVCLNGCYWDGSIEYHEYISRTTSIDAAFVAKMVGRGWSFKRVKVKVEVEDES